MTSNKTISNLLLLAVVAGLSLACSTAHTSAAKKIDPPATAAATDPALAASSPAAPAPQSEEDKMPRVNGADAVKLAKAGEAILIDVRSEDSYRLSHATGALNVTLDKVEKGDHKLPKDKRIIAYCT